MSERRETAWAVLHGDAYDGESNDAAIAYVSGLEREVEALRVAVTARDVALRECADHAEQLRATIQRVREVCDKAEAASEQSLFRTFGGGRAPAVVRADDLKSALEGDTR